MSDCKVSGPRDVVLLALYYEDWLHKLFMSHTSALFTFQFCPRCSCDMTFKSLIWGNMYVH